jgi:hypothetical protein
MPARPAQAGFGWQSSRGAFGAPPKDDPLKSWLISRGNAELRGVILTVLALAAFAITACGDGEEREGDLFPARGGQSNGADTPGGEAGTSGSMPAAFGWKCATAAGVCTCRDVGDESIERESCPASPCCFTSESGTCSCRLETAPASCAALRSALLAVTLRDHCP